MFSPYKVVPDADKFLVMVLTYSPNRWAPWSWIYITSSMPNSQKRYAQRFNTRTEAENWIKENYNDTGIDVPNDLL